MWNHYFTPTSLSEALHLLGDYQARARIIAGGTDLMMDFLCERCASVEALIDIASIKELKGISLENGVVKIGSAVTLAELIRSDLLRSHVPVLVEAARQIAGPQIRNVATVGGNVVNASPAADTIPALLVLESMVSIIGVGGTSREIPLHEFLRGNREVDLRMGEVVTGFHFSAPDTSMRALFRKVRPRRSMSIAILNLAVLMGIEDRRIKDVRIAMGAVAPTAVRIKTVENALKGVHATHATNPELYVGVKQDIMPIDDFRASRMYRLKVARNLLPHAIGGLLGVLDS